jgi:hypothetical protein
LLVQGASDFDAPFSSVRRFNSILAFLLMNHPKFFSITHIDLDAASPPWRPV